MKKLLLILFFVLIFTTPLFAGGSKILWDAPSDSEVTGYKIYHKNIYTNQIESHDAGDVLAESISNLNLAFAEYEFWVTAYNEHGESGPSVSIFYKYTPDAPAVPGPPQNLRIE